MVNLKNVRIWVSKDVISGLREKYSKETKAMTDDTLVNWALSDLLLVQEAQ